MPVSVVGDRLCQDGSALSKASEVLASNGISVTMGTSSSLALTFAVQVSKHKDAVKALHERLIKA